jgi:hypothetical protein
MKNNDPDINPHSYIHLMFDKGTQTYDREMTTYSINVAEKTECLHA